MKTFTTVTDVRGWNSLLQNACSGNTNAMEEVAFHFENGLIIAEVEIVPMDFQQAIDWARRAAESGGLEGMVRYADYLSAGVYCNKDVGAAMGWYEAAITGGSAIAARNLAIYYRDRQDFTKAFELFMKAHEMGEAMDLELGLCYYHGIGVAPDKRKSYELFMSMDANLHAGYEVDEVNYLIGKMFLEGEVVERSLEKARHYLELANADSDHRSANYLLMVIGSTK